MDQLNEKLPAVIVEFVTNYMAIVLLAAVVLVLIVLILIICLAVNSSKNKKKLAELEEQHKQNLEHAVQEARAQGEEAAIEKFKQDGGEVVVSDEAMQERCNNMSAAIDDLNHDVLEKQNKIDELTAALEKAKSGAPVTAESSRESEYAEAIEEWEKAHNELEAENTELKQKFSIVEAENKRLENEIKLRMKNSDSSNDRLLNENLTLTRENAILKTENERLAAENESLKGTGGAAYQAPAKKTAAKPEKTATAKAAAKPIVKLAAKVAAKAEPADDDDEDEVYDEFGDENSTIKVKIKYDRNKSNWVITRSDSDRTYRRVATKQEALSLGKDLARRLQAQLVVHKKDGKFQKV